MEVCEGLLRCGLHDRVSDACALEEISSCVREHGDLLAECGPAEVSRLHSAGREPMKTVRYCAENQAKSTGASLSVFAGASHLVCFVRAR